MVTIEDPEKNKSTSVRPGADASVGKTPGRATQGRHPPQTEPPEQLSDDEQFEGYEGNGSGTRVLLVEDHQMVRQGLRSLIDAQPDMYVVGEAQDGSHAVRLARRLVPDIVIMDVALPHLNGVEATRQIVAANPDIKVIGLSMHSDKLHVGQMLKVGASAYLLKDDAFDELIHAVHAVTDGQSYLSPDVANIVVQDLVRNGTDLNGTVLDSLTPREREVLQLISEGFVTKQIATRLSLSVKTVESHRQQLMKKLDVHSIAGLTKFALRQGITMIGS